MAAVYFTKSVLAIALSFLSVLAYNSRHQQYFNGTYDGEF